jgi:hypothetical protein
MRSHIQLLFLAEERHDVSLSGFDSLALSHVDCRLLLGYRLIFGEGFPCCFLPSDCAQLV